MLTALETAAKIFLKEVLTFLILFATLVTVMDKSKQITVTTDDVLTIGDAAKELGIARMTLYRWINSGKALALILGGVTFLPRNELVRLKKLGNNNLSEAT